MIKLTALVVFQSVMMHVMPANEKYIADKTGTKLEWHGEKVTGKHSGTISLESGWLTWKNNMIVEGEFEIDMASLRDSDGNSRLEGHLRSEDFFNVDEHPVAKLVVTGSTPFNKGTGMVKGILTIKGISHPIEFKAAIQAKDSGLWFFSNITIDRTKYDIRYGSGSFFDNLGDKTIFDEFTLKVSLMVKTQV